MKLRGVKAVKVNREHVPSYSNVICASGYETRASHLISQLTPVADHKIVLGFAEHRDHIIRRKNDALFADLGYTQLILKGSDSDGAEKAFDDSTRKTDDRPLHILVDISSMSRSWYGGFVRSLKSGTYENPITVDFAYVPAEFRDPNPIYPPNRYVGPVRGFSGLGLPNKPTALAIGLGHDFGRALGIAEEVDPRALVLFYSRPASDPRYERSTKRANRRLLQTVPPERQFPYPLTDPAATYQRLDAVCWGLTPEWRVVLTSLGPKTFGLCAFLVAANNPDVSVWRVSAASGQEPVDHKPSNEIVILRTTWEKAGQPHMDESVS